MTTFECSDFYIYSGERGDVIDRLDGIWVEMHGEDTEKWRGMLDDALLYAGYKR